MHGFRVLKRRRSVGPELVHRFKDLPVANVSDCMSRMTAAGPRLLPMHAGGRMAGPALTVKSRPGDNLMVHKAMQLALPGDVIVVDAGGDLTNAIIGEIMVLMGTRAGLAGFVINGAIRDADAIKVGTLPVFAAGVTHRGPYKDGPGEINVPIAIDGMVIEPGDLVIGDGDGVLCIPYGSAQALLEAGRAKAAAEAEMIAQIEAGTYSHAWVDATLRKGGCVIEQD
ncbi:RraA family protein [Roseomonas sp. WA12]